MDEVLNKLESTAISQHTTRSSYDELYKHKEKSGGQEQRRSHILEIQKSNRDKNIDQLRGILDLVNSMSDDTIFSNSRRAYYRPTIQVSGFNKAYKYRDVLMLSEWMTEKPADFEENWLVLACPKGARTMVVAYNGKTKVFSRYGHFMLEARTVLPGGNSCDYRARGGYCVLDCIYDKPHKTMYVLDIIAWNSQPMTDGECDFRYYWMKTYLAEVGGVSVLSKKNQIMFKILQKHPCDKESFNNVMQTYPYFDPAEVGLDGLLFYHKLAPYVSGESPVTVWLYPYMVPEIIAHDISISPAYMLQKPYNYTTQAQYIKEFEMKQQQKLARVRRSGRNSSSQMDTTDPEQHKAENGKTDQKNTIKLEGMESETAKENTKTESMESDNIEKGLKRDTDSTEVKEKPIEEKV